MTKEEPWTIVSLYIYLYHNRCAVLVRVETDPVCFALLYRCSVCRNLVFLPN
jgi:hypothetical protein